MISPYLPVHVLDLERHTCETFAGGRRHSSRPSLHLFDSWLRKAYELLGDIPRERWTLWHSIRRQWATERKRSPMRDVTSGAPLRMLGVETNHLSTSAR